MPRQRKVVTETETLVDDGRDDAEAQHQDPEDSPEQTTEARIADILDSMQGSSGTVTIHRKAPRGINFDYVERLGMEDFNLEDIKRRFGGGTYRLQFRDSSNKIKGNASITVDPRLKGELDQINAPAPPPDNKMAEALTEELSKKNSDMTTVMLQMMQMQQAQHAQTLQLMTTAMSQPKPNTMKEVAAVAAPFIPLFIKLIEGRSVDPTLKTLEVLGKAKEILGDGGGSDGGSAIEKMIAGLAPAIMAKMGQQPSAPAPATTVTTDAPQNVVSLPNPQLPPPADAPTLDPNDPEMLKRLVTAALRSYYPKLCKAAQNGADASAYFLVIADDLDEQPASVTDALIEILKQDDWSKVLFGVDELPHPEWFAELRQKFLDWDADNGDGAEQEPPASASLEAEPNKKKKAS